jgi:hypothetical protein
MITRSSIVVAVLLAIYRAHSALAAYPSELTETSPLHPPENLPPTRVPHVFYPDRYWIRLQPYFPSSVTYPKQREFTFDGSVSGLTIGPGVYNLGDH